MSAELHFVTFYVARTYASPSTITSPKPPKFGQPHATTHPHLVRPGELTPGVPGEEYERRRRQLMESLGEGAKVVCMGGTVRLMSQSKSLKYSSFLQVLSSSMN